MYDLHSHSCFSDGELTPEELINEAKSRGLTLFALTDHDTADGTRYAAAEAERIGQPFLAGIEIEAAYPEELHILGLGTDPDAPLLSSLVSRQEARRRERGAEMLRRLAEAGIELPEIRKNEGALTKGDIAAAIVGAGLADSVSEAFRLYLGDGSRFYVPMEHPSMEETMQAIIAAGGVAVLAHPMNIKGDTRPLIARLKELGLWGIEAFYSAATEEQTRYYLEIAREFGLRPTCGSDFHGAGRRKAAIGCAWREEYELAKTELLLKRRFGVTEGNPVGRPQKPARRGFSEEEFALIADRITSGLPEELFTGLNGGVVISDREKLHSQSRPSRPLYVLGEYHHSLREGRYIVLYYGSFLRAHGAKRGPALENELRKVILHEFRHHLENRAGEHNLEYEDDAFLAAYEEGAEASAADIAAEDKR